MHPTLIQHVALWSKSKISSLHIQLGSYQLESKSFVQGISREHYTQALSALKCKAPWSDETHVQFFMIESDKDTYRQYSRYNTLTRCDVQYQHPLCFGKLPYDVQFVFSNDSVQNNTEAQRSFDQRTSLEQSWLVYRDVYIYDYRWSFEVERRCNVKTKETRYLLSIQLWQGHDESIGCSLSSWIQQHVYRIQMWIQAFTSQQT
jgi:hypothetical protein